MTDNLTLIFVIAAAVIILALTPRRKPARCPDCGAMRGRVHKPRCAYWPNGDRVE